MTADIDIPVSDFLAASGERWPITEAMTLSEEDRGALRDAIANVLDRAETAKFCGMKRTEAEDRALAARLQSKLDTAQANP